MLRTKPLVVALSLLSLTACAQLQSFRGDVDKEATANTGAVRDASVKMDETHRASVSALPWLGGSVTLRNVDRLPSVFYKAVTIAPGRGPMTLAAAAGEITDTVGIPVRLSADITNVSGGQSGSAGAVPQQGAPAQGVAQGAQQQLPAWGQTVDMSFYNAKLSDILDRIAAEIGVSWEYRHKDGAIYFSRYVTKTLPVHILPGSMTQSASVGKTGSSTTGAAGGGTGGGGGGGGGSFSSTSNSSLSSTMESWSTVEASLRAMLTPNGKLAVSPATQSVTVTDSRDTMERVERYIDELNIAMTKQVMLKVDVVAVTLNNSNELGINWSAVYSRLNAIAPNYTLSFAGVPAAGAANGAKATFAMIAPTGGAPGKWDGSTAMFAALAAAGKTTAVNTSRIMALNNQPSPIAITNQESFVQSTSAVSGGAAGGTATSLNTATLTTGYILNVLPSILDDSNLLVQFSVDISTKTGMATFSSGGQTTQQPSVASTQFMQRSKIKIGETVVISGYTSRGGTYTSSGMGDPGNFMLGGGFSGTKQVQELVIMITPLIGE